MWDQKFFCRMQNGQFFLKTRPDSESDQKECDGSWPITLSQGQTVPTQSSQRGEGSIRDGWTASCWAAAFSYWCVLIWTFEKKEINNEIYRIHINECEWKWMKEVCLFHIWQYSTQTHRQLWVHFKNQSGLGPQPLSHDTSLHLPLGDCLISAQWAMHSWVPKWNREVRIACNK